MSKTGCFKETWDNKPRMYFGQYGWSIVTTKEDCPSPFRFSSAKPIFKKITTTMSPLCRFDRRKETPGCDGCAKPWDVDYIRENFGNEFLTTQLQIVRHD